MHPASPPFFPTCPAHQAVSIVRGSSSKNEGSLGAEEKLGHPPTPFLPTAAISQQHRAGLSGLLCSVLGCCPLGFLREFWNKASVSSTNLPVLSLWGSWPSLRILHNTTSRFGFQNSGLFPSPQWGWCGGAGPGVWMQATSRSPPRCMPSVLHCKGRIQVSDA